MAVLKQHLCNYRIVLDLQKSVSGRIEAASQSFYLKCRVTQDDLSFAGKLEGIIAKSAGGDKPVF